MVSGGLDSFLARARMPKAKPLFIEWGQPYLGMEREAVSRLYPDAIIVRMEGLPVLQSDDPYVAARNLMFACVAARFGDRVCLAGMRDEMCADKSPEAFREMSRVLSAQCRGPIEVFSPFWNSTKSEAVRGYLEGGGDPSSLLQTVSCYGSGESPCLDCEACFRRFVALRSNGLGVPRPSDAVVRAYGLHRVAAAPIATAYATLRALHLSGTPVVGVHLEDLDDTPPPAKGEIRVIFTQRRRVRSETIRRVLVTSEVPFDAVLTGVTASFFDFH